MSSPECRIVFRSADPSLDAAEWEQLARAVQDWDRALGIATKEAAISVFGRGLLSATTVPAALAEQLKMTVMLRELQMQQLAVRAQRTVAMLGEAGIPVLLLKGAAVGAYADSTFRERPMTDVDLLVHRADVERAREVIIASGWPETTNPVYLELLQDAHHRPPFVAPEIPGVRLEMHVSVMPDDHSFAWDERDLWRDARLAPAPFAGAMLPSPEHMVLHACVHFAWQHTLHFGAWRTFRSIAILARRPGLDWDSLVRQAIAAKAHTSCYWTLRLAGRLAGLRVPDDVLVRLAPPTPEWLRAAVERHIIAGLAPGESPGSPSERATRLLWRIALRPKWSGHRQAGRSDPDQKWAKAYGTASTETAAQRWLRHARAYREWWRWASETLRGRSR